MRRIDGKLVVSFFCLTHTKKKKKNIDRSRQGKVNKERENSIKRHRPRREGAEKANML